METGISFLFFVILVLVLTDLAASNGNHTDNFHDVKDDAEFINPYETNRGPTEADDMMKFDHHGLIELRVTTLQNMPYSGTVSQNGTLVGVGIAFDVMNLLRSKLNFTYQIVLPERNALGDATTGVYGLLSKQQVDVAVAFLPVLSETGKWLQYGTILDDVEWTILMKRPRESATAAGLLAPFDATVWTLILITVITAGPIIYLLIFLRSRLCKIGEPKKYSYTTCMWFVYGALLKQGSTLAPVTDSARLLFATWWIFITILTSFYTANLTAFLTLSQFTLPINSVKDLADKNLRWFADKGHVVEELIREKSSTELYPLRRSVEKHYGEFINIDSNNRQYVLDFVTEDKMYIRDRPSIAALIFEDYLNKTRRGIRVANRCTYVIMPQKLFSTRCAFGFPLKSNVTRMFNSHLLALVESGIVKFKLREYSPNANICPLNLGSIERQLRNSDLTMTYQCIGIGFTVAILAFVGEVLYRVWTRRKRVKNERDYSTELPVYRIDATFPPKRSPPPHYQAVNNGREYKKKRFINGRDYYVVREKDGEQRLVPVRTPSAFLFPYAV